jgi:hypothetical protein
MSVKSVLLFSEFGISDLFSIPNDSQLMPLSRIRGALSPYGQNIYCVLLI